MQNDDDDDMVHRLVSFCTHATDGRDVSHGVAHMTQVRINAITILDTLVNDGEYPHLLQNSDTLLMIRRMTQAVAQFHDIADHKYVTDPSQCGLETELGKYFSPDIAVLIVQIMEAVSYSKERRLRQENNVPISFLESLGEVGALVRDIVSDADKLEAIGVVGVERCMGYAREYILKTEHRTVTEDEVNAYLVAHAKEKLLFLFCHNYIRTSVGRTMARPHHQKMLDIICTKLGDDYKTCDYLRNECSI